MKHLQIAPGNENSSRGYNRPTFEAPNLILVERPDEFQFLRFLRPRQDVQIHVYEGKDQLQLELATIRGIEGFDKVRQAAIIRDADQDPKAALQSVLQQWSNAFREPMPKVTSDTWYSDSDGRRWGVWIMPEPDVKGDLEELLWQAVIESAHRSCIDDLMACLDQCEPIPFRSKTKARLYAWLSTQHNPLKELHSALKSESNLFNPADPVFARFGHLIDNM